jgi:hypothetical protein
MAVFIVIALLVILFVFSQSSAADVGVVSCSSGACMSCGISNDPGSWPTGDRIWDVCRAIATAEGANVAGSTPDRLNNPGDISDGGLTYGFELHSGSSVTKFPDKKTGWQWLYSKIKNAFVDGNSSVYSADMTWTQFSQKYAGDWQNWLANVTGELGVQQDSRVGDYFVTG